MNANVSLVQCTSYALCGHGLLPSVHFQHTLMSVYYYVSCKYILHLILQCRTQFVAMHLLFSHGTLQVL